MKVSVDRDCSDKLRLRKNIVSLFCDAGDKVDESRMLGGLGLLFGVRMRLRAKLMVLRYKRLKMLEAKINAKM